jgi:hypothetical protein
MWSRYENERTSGIQKKKIRAGDEHVEKAGTTKKMGWRNRGRGM